PEPTDTVALAPTVAAPDTAGGLVDPILSGTAEPLASIVAAFEGRTASTTADDAGAWSLAVQGLPAGTTSIAVTQTDAAGNRSEPTVVAVQLSSPQLVLTPSGVGWRGELRGVPGATVEVRIARVLGFDVTLDGNGRAAASGSLLALISNFTDVSVRYVSGDRTGPSAGITRG
ncbi:Ig-like domain-containing protein, partial [Agromyces terreus]